MFFTLVNWAEKEQSSSNLLHLCYCVNKLDQVRWNIIKNDIITACHNIYHAHSEKNLLLSSRNLPVNTQPKKLYCCGQNKKAPKQKVREPKRGEGLMWYPDVTDINSSRRTRKGFYRGHLPFKAQYVSGALNHLLKLRPIVFWQKLQTYTRLFIHFGRRHNAMW